MPDSNAIAESVGGVLRRKRKESKLSLVQAAKQIGVSASQLSRMERGAQQITVVELMTFAVLYDCNVTDFLFVQDPQLIHLTRREDRPLSIRNVTAEGKVIQEHLLNAVGLRMVPLMIFMPPSADSGEPLVHDGDDLITVVNGTIRIWIGATSYDLHSGDSIYFEANVPHRWVNLESKPTVVFLVTCPWPSLTAAGSRVRPAREDNNEKSPHSPLDS